MINENESIGNLKFYEQIKLFLDAGCNLEEIEGYLFTEMPVPLPKHIIQKEVKWSDIKTFFVAPRSISPTMVCRKLRKAIYEYNIDILPKGYAELFGGQIYISLSTNQSLVTRYLFQCPTAERLVHILVCNSLDEVVNFSANTRDLIFSTKPI